MWRPFLVCSLLVTLALGSAAQASPDCRFCLESVQGEKGGTGTTLRFTIHSAEDAAFPETGSAVIMQFDEGKAQGKCLNVSLRRIETDRPLATYSGTFTAFQDGAYKTFTGRVDIGGDIHEFTVPLDGSPGEIRFITGGAAQAPAQIATNPPQAAAPAAPAPVPAAPAPVAPVQGSEGPAPMVLGLALVVAVTLIGAYADRRRALSRARA